MSESMWTDLILEIVADWMAEKIAGKVVNQFDPVLCLAGFAVDYFQQESS